MTNKIIKCLKNVDRVVKDGDGVTHVYMFGNKTDIKTSDMTRMIFNKCPKCGYMVVFDLEDKCVECGYKIKSVDTIPADDMTKT